MKYILTIEIKTEDSVDELMERLKKIFESSEDQLEVELTDIKREDWLSKKERMI